jgi:hypothetical protein
VGLTTITHLPKLDTLVQPWMTSTSSTTPRDVTEAAMRVLHIRGVRSGRLNEVGRH